jgi:small multidrug resistance pump
LHGYLFLIGAILSEVCGTLALRASEGFSRPLYAVVVVVGYCGAFALLSFALQRGIPLGVAYGVWAAAGVALVAVLSVPLFGDGLTGLQYCGLALVMVGVFAIEIGAAD